MGEVRRPRLWYDSPIDRGGGERLVVRYRLLSLCILSIYRGKGLTKEWTSYYRGESERVAGFPRTFRTVEGLSLSLSPPISPFPPPLSYWPDTSGEEEGGGRLS